MTQLSNISKFILLIVLCIIIGIISLMLGRYSISIKDMVKFIASWFSSDIEVPAQVKLVILKIRLPRVLAAFFVGGTLSITGATYQGMFRNPMVSPSILGVSAGAGFGAAFAILLGLSAVLLQISSFVFGIVAVIAVYLISLSTGRKHEKCLTLILAGMIVATVFTALISILKYIADPEEELPSIVYWLMGSLAEIEGASLTFIVPVALVGLLAIVLSSWKLDILSFGDDEARSMGINVDRFRLIIIAIATLMTAAAVSISGIIGWVGLLIPHIARMLLGAKNSTMLPASFLIGGLFLLIVDDFSRTITNMEIPLGITTSIIGAPFFIMILMRTSKKD